MSDSESGEILRYVPFMSFVHPSFWHTLTEQKLDVDKLDESIKLIHGRFTYRYDIAPVFEVDGTSFNREYDTERSYENVSGSVINKNNIEDFKNIDKSALLNSVGEVIWANIKNKLWIEDPSYLMHFLILSYSDLKKFHYYYWFAFPSPKEPSIYVEEKDVISCLFTFNQMEEILEGYKALDKTQQSFFIVIKKDDNVCVKKLSDVLRSDVATQNDIDTSSIFFTFVDPSIGINPGWTLRLFLAALIEHCPSFAGSEIQVLGIRMCVFGNIFDSRTFRLKIPQNVQPVESSGWVGWERNNKGYFGPRFVNMAMSMDKTKLADAGADLNIKLMKWRLVPDLNVDIMKNVRCLLLGAGTLGCHVARNLVAWGFRKITFMDSGKVSYSNPTRQVLYTHQDSRVPTWKAEAAAKSLKRILPTVDANGIVAHIPMPGHPIGECMLKETMMNITALVEAITGHDVVFLLLDTREARWLPTLLSANLGRIIINAALGFDSYLVMRCGVGLAPAPQSPGSDSANSSESNYCIPGDQLGCYFCNDVTAPGNSMRDRSLDQQCTVTRPGTAAIAGALAVEMLVSLLQHPLQKYAPAIYNLNDEDISEDGNISSVLGPIPHAIRGFLYDFTTVSPTTAKFKQCIACSDIVIKKYRAEREDFVLKAINSKSYLEEATGLVDLQIAADLAEILTLSDKEDEEDDDSDKDKKKEDKS